MTVRRVKETKRNFVGGLRQGARDYLNFNHLARASNTRFNNDGTLSKRPGVRKTNNSALEGGAIIQGVYTNVPGLASAGQPDRAIAIVDGEVYTSDSVDGGAMTWTIVGGGPYFSTGGSVASFATFFDGTNSVVYISTGTLLGKFFSTGPVVTTGMAGVPTDVMCLAVFNSRLWGLSSDGTKLYFSGIENGDTLGVAASGGGTIVLKDSGAGQLTSLAVLGNSLYVFALKAIYRFTGWGIDDFQFDSGTRGLSSTVGCIGWPAVAATDDHVYFTGVDGFYRANESGVEKLSAALMDAQFVASTKSLLVGAFPPVPGGQGFWMALHVKSRHEVWFWSGLDTQVYVYNYLFNAWTGPWAGAAATTLGFGFYQDSTVQPSTWVVTDTSFTTTNPEHPVILIGYQNGFIAYADYESVLTDGQDSSGSGGSNITFSVELSPFTFGDPYTEVAVKSVFITYACSGALTVTCTTRPHLGPSSVTIGATSELSRTRIDFGNRGASPKLSFSSTDVVRLVSAEMRGFMYNRQVSIHADGKVGTES